MKEHKIKKNLEGLRKPKKNTKHDKFPTLYEKNNRRKLEEKTEKWLDKFRN